MNLVKTQNTDDYRRGKRVREDVERGVDDEQQQQKHQQNNAYSNVYGNSFNKRKMSEIQAENSKKFVKCYDMIEESRMANDVLYAILFGGDEHIDNYLPNLVNMVLEMYGKSLPENGRKAIESVCSSDRVLKHAFFFMAMYAFPPFLNFLMKGNPQQKIPPPPLVSREGLMIYIENKVGRAVENMRSGNTTLQKMVYHLRPEYVFSVGVYRDFEPVYRPTARLKDQEKIIKE
jgi:hypothetical protein